MRYAISILATIFLVGIFSVDAEAQIMNRLKDRAKKAAADKAEEKVAEQVEKAAQRAVERSWNAVFGEMLTDTTSGQRIPFSMSSNVETEDAYSFTTITTMEIRTVDDKGKEEPPITMDMHFNEEGEYTGTGFESEEMKEEDGDLFIIYDFKNAAMLMLMDNEGEKFSFAYDWEQNFESEDSDSLYGEDVDWENMDEWQDYKKIGSKNIMGYDADGYRSESDNEIIELWVTRDTGVGMNNLFYANANTKQMKGKIPEEYPYGMLLEMKSENLKSGEITTMEVVEIDENASVSYSMADYPAMSLGDGNSSEK
ncbi:MAG: DUF4412 domain-containing protein [Bacteroidota bacterium]